MILKMGLLIPLVLLVLKIFTPEFQMVWLFLDYYTLEHRDKRSYYRTTRNNFSERDFQILESTYAKKDH